MKHTPGPWEVSRNNAGAIPLHFQPPEVFGRGGNCCVASNLGNGPESEANARLIAAAPELLEALQECLTDDGAACYRSREYAEKRIRYIDTIARAAIAKSEGR
jgi:hypothetical protein